MKKLLETSIAVIISGIVLVSVIWLLWLLLWIPGNWECSTKAKQMGFDHKYGLVAGCMINPKGNWIPLESYRVL